MTRDPEVGFGPVFDRIAKADKRTALDDYRARKLVARAKKRDREKLDQRIGRVYYATCSGVQISIMDMGKVFEVGRKAIAEGADDVALAAVIQAFVQTIRKN